jgi:6-phosphogluconolactonase
MKLKVLCLVGLTSAFLWVTPVTGNAIPSGGPFAYVANSNSSSISGYSVNTTTGALTSIGAFAGGFTNSLVEDVSGRFLYATVENANQLLAYSIDPSTGALLPLAGSPYTTGDQPNSVKVDPSGRFVYTANEEDRNLSVFSINLSTGALTEITGSPFPAGSHSPDSLAFDPSGRFVYVTDDNFSGTSAVLAFSLNQITGAPAFVGSVASGFESDSVVVDPGGNNVYVANFDDGTISVYSINQTTGALTPHVAAPFFIFGTPDEITIDPSGRFLYTASDGNGGPSAVAALAIDPTTGDLSGIGIYPAGIEPSGVTTDAAGTHVYTANESSNDITGLNINSSNGTLTPIAGGPYGAGTEPVKIVLGPTKGIGKCAPGLTAVHIAASANTGSFTGLFCVNGAGVGTYTQGTAFGSGTVTTSGGVTRISAYGTNLALVGQTNGTVSSFRETAPLRAQGTFVIT